MKTKKILIALATLAFTTQVFAHCPSPYKEEKVCMMFDDNILYIYDQKVEHNGPYKDLEKAEVVSLKSLTGEKLEYKKVARGIYKVSSAKQKTILVEVSLGKKKQDIKVSHE